MVTGVNLGNWLVLEKWMSPDLFAGTSAEDVFDGKPMNAGKAVALGARLHRPAPATAN